MTDNNDKPEPGHAQDDAVGASPSLSIERILDIGVPVVVVLAQKDMTMREVLQLVPGAVVQFEKNIEEPIELMVNNITVATGSTVKMGEHFGLQIREMVGASAAICALGGKRAS